MTQFPKREYQGGCSPSSSAWKPVDALELPPNEVPFIAGIVIAPAATIIPPEEGNGGACAALADGPAAAAAGALPVAPGADELDDDELEPVPDDDEDDELDEPDEPDEPELDSADEPDELDELPEPEEPVVPTGPPSNSWIFCIQADAAAGTVTIPAVRLLLYVTLYDELSTVGEPPVSTVVNVLLPQIVSLPELTPLPWPSSSLQAEELLPRISADTPPAEFIDEKLVVTLPPSVSESSKLVSLSMSALESDSVYIELVLKDVVVVVVVPVCGLK